MRILLLVLVVLIAGCGLTQKNIAQRDVYTQRAKVYFQAKKYLNALQQLEKALDIDDSHKPAIVYMAWSLFHVHSLEKSEEWFLEAQKQDDADSSIHYGLASVYYKKGIDVNNDIVKTEQQINQQKKRTENANHTLDLENLKERILDLENLKKEKQKQAKSWFERSVEHYEQALRYSKASHELHYLIANAHIMLGVPVYSQALETAKKSNKASIHKTIRLFLKKGLPHYKKAFVSLDSYIKIIDEEWKTLKDVQKQMEENRNDIELSEKEKVRLDATVEAIKQKVQANRTLYRIAQGFAGEWSFQLAILMKNVAPHFSGNEKSKYINRFNKYIASAEKRVDLMKDSSPNLISGWRNLAQIAKLKGDYESALKYLQEYIKRSPMASASDRAIAKLEIKEMGGDPEEDKKKKKDKDKEKDKEKDEE